MVSLAFYLFTFVIIILWIAGAVNMAEFSEDGATPFSILVGSPIIIAIVAGLGLRVGLPLLVVTLAAIAVFLVIAVRALIRLITNKDIGVSRTVKMETIGNVRRTTYRSDYLTGKAAIRYWTWQIVIPLAFSSYLLWFEYRMGIL